MGCGCGAKATRTMFRLTAPGGVSADYSTLADAQSANTTQYGGRGIVRTIQVPK